MDWNLLIAAEVDRVMRIPVIVGCLDGALSGKALLSSKVFGEQVRIETHGKDRYGRVLGTIWLADKDINRQMVADGWAWHYLKYSDSKALASAEKHARAEKAGLWSDPHAMPPWEWRALKRSRSRSSTSSTVKSGRSSRPPPAASGTDDGSTAANFWLNTSSNVRHNAGCKYFNATKRGRFCGPNDGKACGICGG